MARPGDIERYEEWRSMFTLAEDGPHTFRQLDKLRRVDSVVWGSISHDAGDDAQKILEISEILSE